MNDTCHVTSKGYRQVQLPSHPRSDSCGRVLEHIVVWERESGTSVPDGCCVHHLNGNKSDNRIENLCLMVFGAHTIFHHSGTTQSEACKQKISHLAKERFLDKRNHPSYKEIDVNKMEQMRKSGMLVTDICSEFGICRRTYYNKMEELNNVS